ncbi:MAG: transcription-repair coupling factor, partial [Deltaproteobacteria bacterium]
LGDVDILGTPARRGQRLRRKKAPAAGLSTLRDLREGDPIIHQDHGIGRYLGLKRLVLGGVDGDYVHLEYAGGDKLYLPVYRLNVLQQYAGPKEAARLDKLGGVRWERAKQRVKDAVLAIAHELLALQAQRALRPGFALPPPDAAYQAFASSFPFEETADQKKAIADVLQDLRRDTPMDRLICGDVGFGKTEVAMRAAFLAVHGGRQVAVLVPTTVLAEQHCNTFAERFAPVGAVVEVLSRFRSAKQTRDILQRLKVGLVDVVVGTHRMLSADVHFKNLGLLVVDEEQRFGVKNKERIKQLRHQVHVLTLSATPIPRTLHMASVGLRDLSLITTPPLERSAIRTEVLRFDEDVMAEAIRRELHRGGQVFVVHNRVQSIGSMVSLVQRLVPEAKVAMAHGQMAAETLENIMVAFVHRETQVLVCTAIIESGIDIPSANTMIVNRADTFGLGQLYQLRGRIGRGNTRAFAYLMLPRSDKLGREASERLGLLKRFSELGAGFQIASHDLEMRGAGDLLGADQSGNIAAVGFELYTELLNEAVERARGQKQTEVVEPDIKIAVAAVLPEHYIPEPMQRLGYYQRMAQAHEDAEVYNIFAELQDLYGQAPPEAKALTEVMVVRLRLKKLGCNALSAAADGTNLRMGLSFVIDAPVDRAHLAALCQQQPKRYRLLPSGKLALTLEGQGSLEELPQLEAIREALGVFRVLGA